MTVAMIRVPIDDNSARILEQTPVEKQAQLRLLIRQLVAEFAQSTPATLFAQMDAMSQEAQRRGLTPELLDTLLRDE